SPVPPVRSELVWEALTQRGSVLCTVEREFQKLSGRPRNGGGAARWIRPGEKSDSPGGGSAGGLRLWRAAYAGLPAEALAKAGGEGGHSKSHAQFQRAHPRKGPGPFWLVLGTPTFRRPVLATASHGQSHS